MEDIEKSLFFCETLANAPDALQVKKDLAKCRHDFSNLKFNYLELESKQTFLDLLGHAKNGDLTEAIADDRIQELETQSAESKNIMKRVKNDVKKLEQQVTVLADDLTIALHRYNLQKKTVQKVKVLSDKALNRHNLGVDGGDVLLDNANTCNTILEKQVNAIQKLSEEIQEFKATNEQNEWKIEPLQTSVDELKAQVDSITSKNESTSLEDVKQQLKFIETHQSCVSSLSGISVKSSCADGFIITVGRGHNLEIKLDEDWKYVSDALLTPPSIDISDIVKHAKTARKGSIPFLISEVRARMRAKTLREKSINEVKNEFVCTESLTGNNVIITLPCGVICTLNVYLQTTPMRPRIVSLDGLAGWNHTLLNECKSSINADYSSPRHLLTFVTALEQRLKIVATECSNRSLEIQNPKEHCEDIKNTHISHVNTMPQSIIDKKDKENNETENQNENNINTLNEELKISKTKNLDEQKNVSPSAHTHTSSHQEIGVDDSFILLR